MGILSQMWDDLSDERRDAWRRRALEVRSRPVFGQSGRLDGSQLFKKINLVLATCGREPLLDPPPLPVFGPNPVVGFVIREERGSPALKLKVAAKAGEDVWPFGQEPMVFAWAPRHRGAEKNAQYAFIGLLPQPRGGWSDITKLYLAKLKAWRKLKKKQYHVPFEGSRIFVRVWQQLNGWEDELGAFHAHAVTPPRRWPGPAK